MNSEENYIEINKKSWNRKTEYHLKSDFYDLPGFIKGKSSLNDIELKLLGDVRGKSVLHLQCHFGQDTLSLARLGADVTGVDFSEKAIESARDLSNEIDVAADFICCDIYNLPNHLDKQFDIVFTSYGTIGWLPDLKKWAKIISKYLKPDGEFIFVEFHPVVWMFDDDFEQIKYNYFNTGAIVEVYTGSYADRNADITQEYVGWNHPISEVLTSLIQENIQIASFDEYDYSPYNCFNKMIEFEKGKFRIEQFGNRLPMVFAVSGIKS